MYIYLGMTRSQKGTLQCPQLQTGKFAVLFIAESAKVISNVCSGTCDHNRAPLKTSCVISDLKSGTRFMVFLPGEYSDAANIIWFTYGSPVVHERA